MNPEILYNDAIGLLQELIRIPSFSREEAGTAHCLEEFLRIRNIKPQRHFNNIWAQNRYFDQNKFSILLNSHHDTVKPNPGFSLNPFEPLIHEGKLFGLGSNDAGGSLVSLVAAFIHFFERRDLPFNLVLALSAEEEISGSHGIESLVPLLPKIKFGIVGEPTLLQMAVAERGLVVLDGYAEGRAGHAAREEGENALYKALDDLEWIRNYKFPRVSSLLGPVKMTVTSMETENKAHNVIPATCHFIVDVRLNELYDMEEVIGTVRLHTKSRIEPRSCRLRSTSIPVDHPLVKAGTKLGLSAYGSPTASDKALMPFPTLKIGPGDSARSHTADEYIFTDEIKKGIQLYIDLLNCLTE